MFLPVCHEIFGGCRKGDYYRYLAEFKTGNDRKEVADLSMKAYQVAYLCIDSIYFSLIFSVRSIFCLLVR